MADEPTNASRTDGEPTEKISPWSPLRYGTFRALWLAAWASNVGTWMQDVGASWLMTSMTKSAIMIALVQTATSFPIFLLSVPAGALADIVDRRKILLVTQAWMLLFAALLGTLTLLGITGPWVLLLLTFALAIGGALNAPAWQATVPELVPRRELSAAVALNSGSLNLARAIGPALGGLIVSTFGPGAVFVLNGLSFCGVIWVIYRWRVVPSEAFAPTERVIGASRAGLRYVRHAPALRTVLIRTGVFMLGGSAFWALLPTVGRYGLKLDSIGYGLLLGSFGAGAVVGAFTIESARRYASSDVMAAGATLLFACTTASLGLIKDIHVLYITMAVGGVAWIGMMSTMNVAAQLAAPAWVRARALAVYLLVFYGCMALGSALWGTVATTFGTSAALLTASLLTAAGLISVRYVPLRLESQPDLSPSPHWPDPKLAFEPELEAGPVLITVEYWIDPDQEEAFLHAMRIVGRARRRDGAIRWNVYRDVAEPAKYMETFVVESWGEHLRQHARVTRADLGPEVAAREFHTGSTRPVITHFVSALRRPKPTS